MVWVDIAIYILFIFILMWKGKVCKCADDKVQVLQNLNALRGVFALEIIVGHVIRYEAGILYPLGKFMICAVAFFFFVSALGLSVSYEEKGKAYLSYKFLLAKPLYLFALAVVIYLINYVVDLISVKELGYCTGPLFSNFLDVTNWYIWKQTEFYILFYFVYKYLKKYRLIVVFGYTVLSSVILYQLGFIEGWWASGFAFPMGLLFGECYKEVKKVLYSVKGIAIVGLLALFGSMCLVIPDENVITMVFMRNSMCLAAIAVFWYLCSYYRFGNNRMSYVLCAISAELYISQFIWLRLSEAYGWHYLYRLLFVCVATFLTAVCIYPIVASLKKARQKVSFLEKS